MDDGTVLLRPGRAAATAPPTEAAPRDGGEVAPEAGRPDRATHDAAAPRGADPQAHSPADFATPATGAAETAAAPGAADAAARDLGGLRDVVLTGGLRAGPGLDALQAFACAGRGDSPDPRLLGLWFGTGALRALLSGPDALARLEEAVDRDLAAIDALATAQLDAVLRAERLRRLEGSWRGLHWLLGRVPPTARVRVRLLVLRWPEACRDFDRAVEFDQSQLFKKVYEEEFGTPGGEPYGLLIGDWELRPFPGPGHPTDDVTGLAALAGVAAAAFAPTVVAAHPALFGLDSHADLGAAVDPTEPMRGPERRRWRSLQEREDSRFLAVLLPRVLARPPWADDGTRPDRFRYRPNAGEPAARAWMNAAYPLAAVVLRAFAGWGWPADIRGAAVAEAASGGVVDGLPTERLSADPPGATPRPPVEVALTDEQERAAVEAGLLPLVGLEGLPEATFAAAPSLHRPPRMTGEAANANQRLSAQFNAVLCVSRFAHCVKLMGRQMTGGVRTADEIQEKLADWLLRFASASSAGLGEGGARAPLRDARVEVFEKPGQPGVFGCTILLQPHYQLDEVGAAFRLTTDLQMPKAA